MAYSTSSNDSTTAEQLSSGHVSSSITASNHDTDNVVNITNFAATVNSSSIRNVTQNACNELNVGHRLQNEQNMSIIHHNVNRLYSKLDEIRLYLNSHYPVSVYSCSETFLSSNILDHQISIKGYTIIRRDRISKEGGGLIVYLKNDIECIRRNDLEHDIGSYLVGN